MTFDGPLKGLKVLELAGLAPAPFAGLILADYGADVVRVDRRSHAPSSASPGVTQDSLTRGKRSISLNLKDVEDKATFLKLVSVSDVLIEGYRPDVMESLDLGPDVLRSLNPRLIYARLTGFRRSGDPWAHAAGHDINYIAMSGLLQCVGTAVGPVPPVNVVGDFAGGGMTCALGVLLALHTRQRTGTGSLVEANMVDGSAYLGTFVRHAQTVPEVLGRRRGDNLLDGGCPYYRCYGTKDGKYVAIGALEPQFYKAFLDGFGLPTHLHDACQDRSRDRWPFLMQTFERRFQELTRDEWNAIYEGTDACVTPVMERILPTMAPVKVEGYAGLPKSITHVDGRERVGMSPGADQQQVFADWLSFRESAKL